MHLPANAIYDIAPVESDERILLLMLPGAKNTPQQLVDNGFIQALAGTEFASGCAGIWMHMPICIWIEPTSRHLLHHTLDEARSHGYRRIWLLGISLGGSGAMICATQRTAEIEGIFLLAPFLGTRGIIAEVEAAGGLADWQAGEIGSRDHERALLEQIRCSQIGTDEFPAIYLGFGSEDRYRGASMMLAEHVCRHTA